MGAAQPLPAVTGSQVMSGKRSIATWVRTVRALGVANCVRVAAYRVMVRCGVFAWITPMGAPSAVAAALRDAVLAAASPAAQPGGSRSLRQADRLLEGYLLCFGRHELFVGDPPRFLQNPVSGRSWQGDRHWSATEEFAASEDIKGLWEPSRFTWATTLASAYRATREPRYLDALAVWLERWAQENPTNRGPNWKCAQETSIRLIHLLVALRILGVRQAPQALVQFVLDHLRRIGATTFYAIAQDNNHATSEAGALIIGACWLQQSNPPARIAQAARRFERRGRRLFTRSILRLVASDGSFAQHSTNYHRLMLDTASLVQYFCNDAHVAGVDARAQERILQAARWLQTMIDPLTGDVPNLGGNDGAQLCIASPAEYRDYRPSVQLAFAVFSGVRIYEEEACDEVLTLLGLAVDERQPAQTVKAARLFPHGGFAVLADPAHRTWGVLRIPRYRFRPSHADGLHLDIWADGVNLIADAGTYSYNAEPPWQTYFSATAAHSTCEFDDRDQMPRLGRFLFGDWLRPQSVCAPVDAGDEGWMCAASYCDAQGASHRREVRLRQGTWTVIDEVSGYRRKAVLRWRLAPGNWRVHEQGVVAELGACRISSDVPLRRIELAQGSESRYYLERAPLPVLEIEVAPGGARIETVIQPATA